MKAQEWVARIPTGFMTVVVAFGGAVLIYTLGRVNESSASEIAQWKASVDLIIKQRQTFVTLRDSLAVVEADALAQAGRDASAVARARAALSALQQQDSVRRETEAALPVDSVATALRLRLIEFNLWGTDSLGVRFLNGFRLEALAAREQMPVLHEEKTALVSQLRSIEIVLGAVRMDRDTTVVRLRAVEALLEEGRSLADCRIAFVIPCPSRGVMFGVGVAAGVAVMVARK